MADKKKKGVEGLASEFNETYDFFRGEINKETQAYKQMSQEEFMMEKKIEEMNNDYSKLDLTALQNLTDQFWKFDNLLDRERCLDQLNKLSPIVIPENKNWVHCRKIISSAEYTGGLGRSMRFYVVDEPTQLILGLIEVKSDFKNVKVRDDEIGWDDELKNGRNKLNNIAILSTLIPVPDFGMNALGAKLIAFLGSCDVVRNSWKNKYNDELEGVSTTSLYGHSNSGSIYTGNNYFRSLGHTNGDVLLGLPKELYTTLSGIVSREFPEIVEKIKVGTNPKQRLLDFIFKTYQVDRSTATHGFKRGIYWCPFYLETNDHLKDFNLEKYTPRFNYSVGEIFQKWLPKSINRFNKLFDENRLSHEYKLYNNLIYGI